MRADPDNRLTMTSSPSRFGALPEAAVDAAARHLRDTLTLAIEHRAPHAALIVYDTRTDLSRVLTEAYRRAAPDARFIDFDATTPDAVLAL
ncbi:conserved hypothetical protein, partial [Ricinus communis]